MDPENDVELEPGTVDKVKVLEQATRVSLEDGAPDAPSVLL
jgi:hypothetical protein